MNNSFLGLLYLTAIVGFLGYGLYILFFTKAGRSELKAGKSKLHTLTKMICIFITFYFFLSILIPVLFDMRIAGYKIGAWPLVAAIFFMWLSYRIDPDRRR